MTDVAPGPVPPGWYPDPAGERQWRVWTGTQWSVATRPYGEAPASSSLVPALSAINALHRVARYGVVAVLAGIGLAVSATAHLPGTAHPLSRVATVTLVDAAAVMLALGSLAYAVAAQALTGSWRPWAFVPGLNTVIVSALVARRLEDPRPARRVVVNVLAVAIFVARARVDPYLGVLPALVAADLMMGAQRLVTQLSGSPVVAAPPS